MGNNWISQTKGCYISVHPDKQSKKELCDFMRLHQVPNRLDCGNLHCTLAHSLCSVYVDPKHCDISTQNQNVQIWKLQDKGDGIKYALVLVLESVGLTKRFNELKELGVKCIYDKFIPHITLSMNVPRFFNISRMIYKNNIRFIHEESKECIGSEIF